MKSQERHNEGKPKLTYVFSNTKAVWGLLRSLPPVFVDHSVESAISAMTLFLSREDRCSALNAALCHVLGLLQQEMGGDRVETSESLTLYVFSHSEAWDEYCRVCEVGAKKYSPGNYRLGAAYSNYADAALRHIRKFMRGIQLDEESGCHHLAHALWNIWQLMDQPDWRDDRLPAVTRVQETT